MRYRQANIGARWCKCVLSVVMDESLLTTVISLATVVLLLAAVMLAVAVGMP